MKKNREDRGDGSRRRLFWLIALMVLPVLLCGNPAYSAEDSGMCPSGEACGEETCTSEVVGTYRAKAIGTVCGLTVPTLKVTAFGFATIEGEFNGKQFAVDYDDASDRVRFLPASGVACHFRETGIFCDDVRSHCQFIFLK